LLGLIVLGAIIDSVDTGGPPEQGQVIDGPGPDGGGGGDGGGGTVTQPVGYTSLSGRWNTGTVSHFDVQVDAAGNFSGPGMSTDGYQIGIQGSIPAGTYQIGNSQFALNGTIAWGGDCHLKFTTYNPDGSINFDDTFHVDHTAGAPCPARFGG
jgi:hypothetical protein